MPTSISIAEKRRSDAECETRVGQLLGSLRCDPILELGTDPREFQSLEQLTGDFVVSGASRVGDRGRHGGSAARVVERDGSPLAGAVGTLDRWRVRAG